MEVLALNYFGYFHFSDNATAASFGRGSDYLHTAGSELLPIAVWTVVIGLSDNGSPHLGFPVLHGPGVQGDLGVPSGCCGGVRGVAAPLVRIHSDAIKLVL